MISLRKHSHLDVKMLYFNVDLIIVQYVANYHPCTFVVIVCFSHHGTPLDCLNNIKTLHINGSMQDCSIPSALMVEDKADMQFLFYGITVSE